MSAEIVAFPGCSTPKPRQRKRSPNGPVDGGAIEVISILIDERMKELDAERRRYFGYMLFGALNTATRRWVDGDPWTPPPVGPAA